MDWENGSVRPVALAALGQRYRRYRLAAPEAEDAMAGSLRRWGQLSPVAACWRDEQLELLDGFKRYAAARQVRELTSLSVRVLEVDEPTAKAAILGLNRDQRPVRELEEAWVVQGLVRDDGMTQVAAAQLLGRHKSWVCRRLALLEQLSVAVKEDLRLGLVGPSLARQLTRLPAGNQEALLALTRRETLVARVCLYDNFKAVVLRHDADGAFYHPKFLAFATHYGFRPQACRGRRPQTKGKVERKFFYVETSLLNGRTFETLAHLNEVTAWWLAHVADERVLRDFKESPRQRQQRELPYLLTLPTSDFDTAQVVYRHVSVEGYVTHRLNLYSVPWSFIGQVLRVRITEREVIIYSIGLEEIARHPLLPSTQTGVRQALKSHHPAADPGQRELLLRQRFSELGPVAVQFLEGLLAKQVQGKLQAQQLLALVAPYQRDDVRAAFERAVRFGAFSLAAVRRILAARAQPKPLLEELADLQPDTLETGTLSKRDQHTPGASAVLSYRYRHKNGSWLRVETAATNLLDDPHVRAVVLNSRDVTEALAAAEALWRSEEQHRALAESIPNLVWVYRPDGTPEYFNRRWTEYTGVDAEDLAAATRPEIVHPDDRPRMREVWERALREGHLYEIEYRLRRADGAYRWHIGRAVPVRDPEGRIARWFGTCTDIHDGRRAEEERSRLAQHIRLLLESTGEGIYGIDHEGHCTFINRAGAAMLGYTPEELLGQEMHSVVHHHRPGGSPYPSDECPIYTAFREGRGVRVEDESFWRKDGTAFRVSYTSYPAAEASFRGAVVNFQDVTEWRQAEAALRLRDRAIRAVAQGILITDATQADNPIIFASPGFEQLTGYTAAEVIGRNCRLLQGPDTDREAVARVRAAVRDGQPCVAELLNYRKDGTSFWNELSISPIRDEAGRLTHFVGVQADVTARRRLEEQYRQAQKMEAVGQLAGGIAHDFNNLLTIINGYTDLLLQSLPPADPSRNLLAEINRAGERSAGLTRQLLAFSRRQVLAPRVLELNAVVADTEKMLRRVIGEDVRLATAPAPGLWPVKADPGQVEQVLLNLAVNARDAMPTGGRLTIETQNVELDDEYTRTHPGARPGPHVLLAVSDTGCGMTDEVKARIFEPFFTTKEAGKGTGLGLATVYGIVTQSGGHVAVYSEVGQGTTFKMYLPRTQQRLPSGKSDPGLAVMPRGCETVLLVEDEDGVRAIARHVLQGCGYTVLEARDGAEALRLEEQHRGRIDLLVTDVVMPRMSGREVAERLAEMNVRIKVLFLSGYTDDAVVRHGILEAEVAFLQKPFRPASLAAKVREVLDGR